MCNFLHFVRVWWCVKKVWHECIRKICEIVRWWAWKIEKMFNMRDFFFMVGRRLVVCFHSGVTGETRMRLMFAWSEMGRIFDWRCVSTLCLWLSCNLLLAKLIYFGLFGFADVGVYRGATWIGLVYCWVNEPWLTGTLSFLDSCCFV